MSWVLNVRQVQSKAENGHDREKALKPTDTKFTFEEREECSWPICEPFSR